MDKNLQKIKKNYKTNKFKIQPCYKNIQDYFVKTQRNSNDLFDFHDVDYWLKGIRRQALRAQILAEGQRVQWHHRPQAFDQASKQSHQAKLHFPTLPRR